ncbi:MAG: family oligoendopeptidase [Clostridia bacterium]|jgi:pepF/M3 family oligoendopeptidase|nr:family oligoendopeptidase [Clostridia bacterium]
MDLSWSLKELYDSFEDIQFKEDIKKLDELIKKIKTWIDDSTVNRDNEKEKLEKYIKFVVELTGLHEKLATFSMLTLSVDSKHELGNKFDAVLEQKMSTLAGAEAKMSLWISETKELDTLINDSDLLKEHAFYLKEIVREQKYKLGEKEEDIIARMQNTGSSAWVTYKNLLIASHKVEIEIGGEVKEMPLTEVLNMAYDKDKEVRKKAYTAEISSYKKIEEGIAAALNAIKGEVLTICEMRGYDSPLDMTLQNSRMDSKTLEVMLEAMKESFPMFRKYLRKKAEMLGYKKGLPFYELYAPIVKKEMPFSYEAGKAFVEKNFRAFSDDLADFARMAMDKHWIDVAPKEGKVGGAFCCGIHSIGECRIMLNYGNNLSDVITMAHELGHGFHNECLIGESILNINYPMPLAETASTFCETIVKKASLKEADEEEALAILEEEISGCTQVIVDIYSRFIFESEVFKLRKDGPLSVNEINNIMLKAQQEAYGEGLDAEYLHPYMWTWKSHYYYADANFYNFPYAFGLLLAKGLYAQYEKDKDNFPKKYEKLLAVTGKKSIADVVKEAGIDVNSTDFWRSSLRIIEEDIERFIELSDKICH